MSKSRFHTTQGKSPSTDQPKTRNMVAVAAHMRNSAGAHDPSKKRRNKQARRAAKQDLRWY